LILISAPFLNGAVVHRIRHSYAVLRGKWLEKHDNNAARNG
jgi:hypothetical protein